jgi:hypothetical protein
MQIPAPLDPNPERRKRVPARLVKESPSERSAFVGRSFST